MTSPRDWEQEFTDNAPRPSPFTMEEVLANGPPLSYSAGSPTPPDAPVHYAGSGCPPALAQKNIGMLFDGAPQRRLMTYK